MRWYRNIVTILFLALSSCVYGQTIEKIRITDLEKTIRESKTPLIVNFWATFCLPCLEEIPYFQEAAKEYKAEGVRLILISLDLQESYPSQIRKTVVKRKISVPVKWLDETNADYFCPKIDSSWSGGMPASLFVNNKSGYRKFFEEQVSREKLQIIMKELTAN